MAWDVENELSLYKLISMSIHGPSEHTFNEEHLSVEIQLVFEEFNSSQIVIAAFFLDEEEGGDKHNNFIESMEFDHTKTTESDFIPL